LRGVDKVIVMRPGSLMGGPRNVADFEMTEGGPVFVTVRHLSENHRYSFVVARRNGKRSLGEVAITSGGFARHLPKHFSSQARAFAESLANKAGLIDEPPARSIPGERLPAKSEARFRSAPSR
jgi:hypothetical protein